MDDIVLNPDPHHGIQFLGWGMTLTTAMFIGLAINYLKSKTPTRQTIMDFVTTVILLLLLCVSMEFSAVATLTTYLSDCGEKIASFIYWIFLVIGLTLRLEVLLLVALQLLCTRDPWLLESSVFETAYKIAVVIIVPAISLTFLLANIYLGTPMANVDEKYNC